MVNRNIASASVSLHMRGFMALYKFVFNFNFNFNIVICGRFQVPGSKRGRAFVASPRRDLNVGPSAIP